MVIESGLPREVICMKQLAFNYSFAIEIAYRYKVTKEEALNSLFKERERTIKIMQNRKFTQEQIKTALKDAADNQKKNLASIGITPEELY